MKTWLPIAVAGIALLLPAASTSGDKGSVREEPGGPALLRREPGEAVSAQPDDSEETTIRVLALLRVDDPRGGFRALDVAGRAGVLVDEMSGAGEIQKAPVFRLWGRARSPESVMRLRNLVVDARTIQTLWLAWARVPADASDPVPLTTVVWSPMLYPSRSSTLTRGPGGGTRYYYDPGSAAVLESSNNGKDFQTAFSAGRAPQFIEGGQGIDLTKVFWRARVAAWMEKQEKLRRQGWEKYGPLLEPRVEPDGGN